MTVSLFFDIDSTLVENHFSRKALGELLGQIATHSQKNLRELGHELWLENSRRQKDDPDNPLTMDWDDILETLAKRYGVTLEGKGINLWQKYAHANDVEVLDNAPQVLQTLKQHGYRLIIATKGLKKYQDPVLRVAGLDHFFDDMLTPDITGYLKTTTAYFNKYLPRPDGHVYVHIGDHYYDDVMTAKRNGFYSVLRAPISELAQYNAFDRPQHVLRYASQISTFPKDGTDVIPDAVVLSLEELPAVIEKLVENYNMKSGQ
jgi:HAD superfamily hydrolase (TIGR01549 family)